MNVITAEFDSVFNGHLLFHSAYMSVAISGWARLCLKSKQMNLHFVQIGTVKFL